jgi:hypothetical protein
MSVPTTDITVPITVPAAEFYFGWLFYAWMLLLLGGSMIDQRVFNSLIADLGADRMWLIMRHGIYVVLWAALTAVATLGFMYVRYQSTTIGWGVTYVLAGCIMFVVGQALQVVWVGLFFRGQHYGAAFGFALFLLAFHIATDVVFWIVTWQAGLAFLPLTLWMIYVVFASGYVMAVTNADGVKRRTVETQPLYSSAYVKTS